MSEFFYSAKDNQGYIKRGSIKADNMQNAAYLLEKDGLCILELKENITKKNLSGGGQTFYGAEPFNLKEKIEFFNSFFFLYKSGLSIFEIFQSMYRSTKNKNIKLFCNTITRKLEKGYSLKEITEKYPNILGIAYSTLITAGEESGKLDEILSNVLKNLKREEEIKSNLIRALTYPCMICSFAIAVFFFFKFFIIKIFESFGSGISSSAVVTLLITALIKIAGIFAIIAGIIIFISKNRKLQNDFLNFISKSPLISNPIKSFSFANYFSIFGLAYQSGIPVVQAVTLANSAIKTNDFKKVLNKTARMIEQGCEISTAFGVANIFSSYAVSQLSAGEKSGDLDKMALIISADYEKKLDMQIQVASKLIEPFTLIFVGVLVCNIAVTAYKSYYSALMNMF